MNNYEFFLSDSDFGEGFLPFNPLSINISDLDSFSAAAPTSPMTAFGSEWDFCVFSGLESTEKPDPKLYEIALERVENIAPEEALHTGDNMRKDYWPAKTVGMHALLIDRFKTSEAQSWEKSGATVLPNMVAVQDWLSTEQKSD